MSGNSQSTDLKSSDERKKEHLWSDSVIDSSFDENKKETESSDAETEEFNPSESIYELEPFVLPGEKISQDVMPLSAESMVAESLISKERLTPESFFHPQEETITELTDEELSIREKQMLDSFKQRKQEFTDQALLDPLMNTIIGERYEIFDILGYGNMAVVYKVKDLVAWKDYAAKTCRQGVDSEDLLRFQLEIETHKKLNHENIVGYVETIKSETGNIFLIMENVKGLSLDEVIEIHGPIRQVENIWNILKPICEALEHAHLQGIIHRDLKSGNVVMSKKENCEMLVKILDFGIAKNYNDHMFKITNPGSSVGTPLYMSPEQIDGQKVTSASDIYALGILAYELVTGRPPYLGKSLMEVMNQHCSEDIKPPSIAELPIPGVEIYESIIHKALEPNPYKRIESASKFKQVLQDWYMQCRDDS